VSFTTEDHGLNAEVLAERFTEKVTAALRGGADPSKSPKWTSIQGCYGTAAWSEAEEIENEARALEVEAGRAEADSFRRAAGVQS
jgi:hypothetical protein